MLLGGSPGSSGGVLGDPGEVLGAALGAFGADWSEQSRKKWRGSMSIAVWDPKIYQKRVPRDPFRGAKSIQNRIKV